ncbi:hypothetical protein COOONC_25602, partial [Cooperia oncophora]
GDGAPSSSTDSDDSDAEDLPVKLGSCHIYFVTINDEVFSNVSSGKLVVHKAFHRYVVRAKQGGAQGAKDKEKGTIHSAGATLRRYNERALAEDIVKVLGTWSEFLAATPLIFIRCASYQRVIFHDIDENGFDRRDPRLRTIPFETKRPLLDEVRRTWERLGSVTCHGPMKDFLAERSKR